MRRDDVFYRDVPSNSDRNDGGEGGRNGHGDDRWSGGNDAGDDDGTGGEAGNGGGLLGDLLGRDSAGMNYDTFLGLLSLHPSVTSIPDDDGDSQAPLFAPQAVPEEVIPMDDPIVDHVPVLTRIQTETLTTTMTITQSANGEIGTPLASSSQVHMESQEDASSAIGFSGIFFRCMICNI